VAPKKADWRQRAEVERKRASLFSAANQEKKVTIRDAIFHKIEDFGKRRQNTILAEGGFLLRKKLNFCGIYGGFRQMLMKQ